LCYPEGNIDPNGNVGRVVDARGLVTTVTFDEEDRPLVTTEGAGAADVQRATEVTSYNGLGLPEEIVEFGVTMGYSYDERGQIHTKTTARLPKAAAGLTLWGRSSGRRGAPSPVEHLGSHGSLTSTAAWLPNVSETALAAVRSYPHARSMPPEGWWKVVTPTPPT